MASYFLDFSPWMIVSQGLVAGAAVTPIFSVVVVSATVVAVVSSVASVVVVVSSLEHPVRAGAARTSNATTSSTDILNSFCILVPPWRNLPRFVWNLEPLYKGRHGKESVYLSEEQEG